MNYDSNTPIPITNHISVSTLCTMKGRVYVLFYTIDYSWITFLFWWRKDRARDARCRISYQCSGRRCSSPNWPHGGASPTRSARGESPRRRCTAPAAAQRWRVQRPARKAHVQFFYFILQNPENN
jgi:hypothetical protein